MPSPGALFHKSGESRVFPFASSALFTLLSAAIVRIPLTSAMPLLTSPRMSKAAPLSYKEFYSRVKLAKQSLSEADAAVVEYKKRLEHSYGIPIEVTDTPHDPVRGAKALTLVLWNKLAPSQTHSVSLGPFSAWLRPYALAHELTHIALESEAHAAGERRSIYASPEIFAQLSAGLSPAATSLPGALFSMCINISADMVVESRLYNSFPSLRPSQYEFINRDRLEEAKDDLPASTDARSHAWVALMGSRTLFADRLFVNTCHFDRYSQLPTRNLAEALYGAFAAVQNFGPGEHYRLVARFAELIGWPELHLFDPRPAWQYAADAGPQVAPDLAPG